MLSYAIKKKNGIEINLESFSNTCENLVFLIGFVGVIKT
jgi:hypothetical protein